MRGGVLVVEGSMRVGLKGLIEGVYSHWISRRDECEKWILQAPSSLRSNTHRIARLISTPTPLTPILIPAKHAKS